MKKVAGMPVHRLRILVAAAATIAMGLSAAGHERAADAGWLQWGGPRRNFNVDSGALATRWPADGPRRIWQRALGEGHSGILADGGRLFTMYRPVGWFSMVRRSQQERIAALEAASGRTLWEFGYDAATEGLDLSQGAGPHSTPLIVGDRLFAMSSRVQLFALDKDTGRLVWSHDLAKEYGAGLDGRGYGPSPIAYRNTVIVPLGVGGPAGSVLAFDQETGALRWKGGTFGVAPASPILITVQGQDQLVISGSDQIVGMDPNNGRVLWSHPHKTEWGLNISTPVWSDDNQLFVSAAYNNGSRLLKLSSSSGRTDVSQSWFQNRMRVHIGTVIRIGDFYVGSSGDFGPCPTVAIDVATGRLLWQSREFARATFLYADGKLIILDEDGVLGLAAPTRTGLNALARAPIMNNVAWTVPTLVGTKLYVRDRRAVAAVELGQ